MMNFQKVLRKIILTSLLGYANMFGNEIVLAQSENTLTLQKADSLYALRQYTESLRLYEQLFYQKKQNSSAMLLKMAFIQEGLGEYSEALYYLNEFYLATSDEAAIEKMRELSAQHRLRGYEYTDYDLFQNLLRKYRYFVIYGLCAILLVILVYIAFSKTSQRAGKPYGIGLAFILALGGLFYITNYTVGSSLAIIMDDHTPIMSAPSSGADVVYISEKGHRVKIEGSRDIWAKIEWNGETAYIRQNNLRPI
ncbi:MAG: SH3 domain-containing protein [Cyclobacteriaceae bacterium]